MAMIFSFLNWLDCKPFMPKHSEGVLQWCETASFLLRENLRKLLYLWRLGGEQGIGSWRGCVSWTGATGAWSHWDSKFRFAWTLHLSWLLQLLSVNCCIFRLCCWIWEGFFHSFYVLGVAVPGSSLNRKHKAAASFLSQTPFILHSSLPNRCCFHFYYFLAARLKLTVLWCAGEEIVFQSKIPS